MSFLHQLTLQTSISESILPLEARNLIMIGKLPNVVSARIILAKNETCHYIDRAILNVKEKRRIASRRNMSMPGLFNETRISYGTTKPIEYEEIVQYKGILYITNQRTIFSSNEKCFEKAFHRLSAIIPYSNAVQLQFGSTIYDIIVPDGGIVNQVYRILSAMQ